MEVVTQDEIASPYVTAPSSPVGSSLNNLRFHSAPASPVKNIGSLRDYEFASKGNENSNSSTSNDFEFETSLKFGDDTSFDANENFERTVIDEQHQHQLKPRAHGESLPTMAFADELFSNGHVLPLKLPPRLQHGNCISIPTSPRSPTSILKSPFSWIMGNDDFDPFMVALEKVRQEKRGGIHAKQHRRTRSLSPFRTTTAPIITPQLSNDTGRWKQCQQNEGGSPLQVESKPFKVLEPKGSAYARWARHQSMDLRHSPHERAGPRGLTKLRSCYFGNRRRSEKMGQDGPIKPSWTLDTELTVMTQTNGGGYTESKTKKIKSLLLRYASFWRDSNESKLTDHNVAAKKPSFFKRLSFKFKGNGIGNGKKRVSIEPKMIIVPYKPSLALCLGYGLKSPRSSN